MKSKFGDMLGMTLQEKRRKRKSAMMNKCISTLKKGKKMLIEKNNSQPLMTWEGKIQYKLFPSGTSCGDISCGGNDECPTCKRVRYEGIGKIPTGKTLLNG